MKNTTESVMDLLRQHLDSLGIKYQCMGAEVIGAGYATSRYVNPAGEKGVRIFLNIDEDGEFISFLAPRAYSLAEASPEKKRAFLEAAAQLSFRTKLGRYGYDPRDGEVRFLIDLALEDGELGMAQVKRCIGSVVDILERHYEVHRKALDEGEIDLSSLPSAPKADEPETVVEMLRETGVGITHMERLAETLAKAASAMREGDAKPSEPSENGDHDGDGGEDPSFEEALAEVLGS